MILTAFRLENFTELHRFKTDSMWMTELSDQYIYVDQCTMRFFT